MTLPTFAAEHRRLQHGARSYRSISTARMALSSKPAGRRCCCRSMGQTDGRTDEWMPRRYIDLAPHNVGILNRQSRAERQNRTKYQN